MKTITLAIITFSFGLSFATANAAKIEKKDLNYAQVTFVKAEQRSNGSWCIDTTVRHNDTGWKHYANGWQVLDENGNELAYRLLAHPHISEQPFTRSKCGIQIPQQVKQITVRAKCTQHGYGGHSVSVNLLKAKGNKFSVKKHN